MIDVEKLKLHAELLEAAINANLGKSQDVDRLAKFPPLVKALKDAKSRGISSPIVLGDGLDRWVFESNIQDFKLISRRLAQFELLLEGWALSDESP